MAGLACVASTTRGGICETAAVAADRLRIFRLSEDCLVENLPFASPGTAADLEEGAALTPKFDAGGLVTCVATDAVSGDVLMVAHMNAEALAKTIASGEAWYFSRSRERFVEEGRKLRPHPARGRDADRLRSGRGLDQGRAGLGRLPYRPPFLLLSRGAARQAGHRDARIPRRARVRSPGCVSEISRGKAAMPVTARKALCRMSEQANRRFWTGRFSGSGDVFAL